MNDLDIMVCDARTLRLILMDDAQHGILEPQQLRKALRRKDFQDELHTWYWPYMAQMLERANLRHCCKHQGNLDGHPLWWFDATAIKDGDLDD